MKKNKNSKFLLLWYSYPRVAIAFILILINLAVILLFTAILSIISGNPFFDELAYIFTYTMCSDGIYDFVNSNEDLTCFIIKIILTIIQMIIFSGALIGFTTDLLSNTFDKRLENKGKLYLKDHFVFLNWSTIGQNIIYDLSFFEGVKNVVILTEDEREDVINSIQNIFTSNKRKIKNLRIFVKKGDPSSIKHLNDISIENAKYVGILLANKGNEENKNISTNDLASFKLLLSMLACSPNANIVVETESKYTKDKIEQLIETTHPNDKQRISIFSHNMVVGHVLGKSVINPRYSSLFHNILSFDGVEFYGIEPMDIDEALLTFNDCIPIINYDDDEVIDENGKKEYDQLYVVSDDSKSLGFRKEKKSYVKSLNYHENIEAESFIVYIFSNSNRVSFVTCEIENHNRLYNSNITYKLFSYEDDLKKIIDEIVTKEGKKKILLLSNSTQKGENEDADVFLSLLELKRHSYIQNEVDIFVEICDINNVLPVQNLGIASVILSNKIISLFMLQLLTHSGSSKFFKDVLVSSDLDDHIDLEILKASELLDFGSEEQLHFSCYSELVQSFYNASNKKRMVLGYFPDDNNITEIEFFADKMDETKDICIHKNNHLIVVLYTDI